MAGVAVRGKTLTDSEYEAALAEDMAKFYDDPLGFVYYSFDWGNGELSESTGPDKWQKEQLEGIGKKLQKDPDATIREAVASGHGIGKMQPHDTQTPTPDGWRNFGDLKVGDSVFGADGKPTRVLAIYERKKLPIYRVSFDDGSSVLACEDHLWNVRGRRERRRGLSGYRTIDTKGLLALGVKRSNGIAEARQWEIPVQKPVQYKERSPIDGYLMGVWLGDGTSANAQITSEDPWILEELARRGFSIKARKPQKGKANSFGVLGGPLREYTNRWSCATKKIPVEFLLSCEQDRLDVVRGLMDTDGYCNKQGSAIFTSTSKALCEGLMELVRSLGGKAHLQPTVKQPFYRDYLDIKIQCKPAYSMPVRPRQQAPKIYSTMVEAKL